MKSVVSRRYAATLLEVAKWGLVLWLVWPITRALHERVSFTRIAAGILLLVIFSGKALYDAVLDSTLGRGRQGRGLDWLTLGAVILIIALVVALTALFVAIYLSRNIRAIPGGM